MMIDDDLHGRSDPEKIDEILAQLSDKTTA